MTQQTVRIAAIQTAGYGNPASFDVVENRNAVLELVDACCRLHNPDIVLLPEIFTAPYFCSSHDERYWELAEPIPGPSTDALAEKARLYGCYIFAPLFEAAVNGEYYDSCALIGPDGNLFPAQTLDGGSAPCARKMHLGAFHTAGTRTDEKFWFRPGRAFAKFHTPLGVLGCLICYDRSFPEAWRSLVLAGADAIFVPVVSYGFREALFLAELQVRAAENGVFAIAANRTGPECVDFEVNMFGNSCIIDPYGNIVAKAASGSEAKGSEIVVSDVDLKETAVARVRVPYLRDRRTDAYLL